VEDLQRAPSVMQKLLELPLYRSLLAGGYEVSSTQQPSDVSLPLTPNLQEVMLVLRQQ
jgi:phosphoenolpyruvate carboxylase